MTTNFVSHSHEMVPKPDYNGGLKGEMECKNCWLCTCHNATELVFSCIPVQVPRRIEPPVEPKESRWQDVYASVLPSKTNRSEIIFKVSYQPEWCKRPIEKIEIATFDEFARNDDAFGDIFDLLVIKIDEILERLAWKMNDDPSLIKSRKAS